MDGEELELTVADRDQPNTRDDKKIKNAKAYGRHNPITGQHVEIICETKKTLQGYQQLRKDLKKLFQKELHESFIPLKIKFDKIEYSYRYKKN